ncbi:MAG: hypothetical protein ACXVVQ_11400 [Solirubrobacteraceae bacterium]
MEIEIRAGFCYRKASSSPCSGWRRITARRRGEIAGEMPRVCDTADVGIAEAWQRRPDQPRFVIGYLHPSVPVNVR